MTLNRILGSLRVTRHRQIPVIRQIQAMTSHHPLTDDAVMRTSCDQAEVGRADASSVIEAILLDDLLDVYIYWREGAQAVTDAYARWSIAPGAERAVRFAAYSATLDQEQKMAAAYAEAVAELQRWVRRSPAPAIGRVSRGPPRSLLFEDGGN